MLLRWPMAFADQPCIECGDIVPWSLAVPVEEPDLSRRIFVDFRHPDCPRKEANAA